VTMTKNGFAGRSVAGCDLIRELGRGSNGVVYLARQQKLNRQVACKIMAPELQDDPYFLDNLFAEAANAAKLSHPNIIQALDAGDDGGLKYFMMEYVDGDSLEDIRLNTPEKISTDFLINISLQLASAMDYAWSEHGMVHGDIKPGNIMVSRRDQMLKIGDLGLARSSNGASGDPEEVMITPLYAPPEIISQQTSTPDQRSDIYSFGVMFYELACGKAPFTGTIEEILHGHLEITPEKLIVMNPDLDMELAKLIDSMLAKDPADRPADWKSVKQKLMAIKQKKTAQMPDIGGEMLSGTSKNMLNTSWAVGKKKHQMFDKFPWLLPALLIIIIATALISIPFSLGLFQ